MKNCNEIMRGERAELSKKNPYYISKHLPDRGAAEQSAGFVQQEPAAHRQRAASAAGQHPHHRCGGHYQLVEEQLLHQGGHRGRRTVCTAEGGEQRQEVIKMEEKSMEKYGAAGH